jgi:L-aminoadipate-semialdehyde dehydrogenase
MDTDKQTSASETSQSLSVTERGIAELWGEVLPIAETFSATANFFALGGDSIAMVTVEYRIKEEFSVQLPPGAMLGAPTVRELSALVDAVRSSSCGHGTPSSRPKDT